MRLAIYSDLHVEGAPFEPPQDLQADVVILAGDIHAPGNNVPTWARRPSVFGQRSVIHVAGNHEFYGCELTRQRQRMQEEAARLGIHHLQMGEVVIEAENADGKTDQPPVRFLGTTLWTDFELPIPSEPIPGTAAREQAMEECARYMNDYQDIKLLVPGPGRHQIRRTLRPSDTLAMHQQERAWLADALAEPFPGPTVVITHHAPHRGSLAQEFEEDLVSAGFVSELPPEFFRVPVLWIHGHTHHPFDYREGGCRIVCNPRGYRQRSGGFEVDGFDPYGLGIELPGESEC